eukprot:c21531_g1_i2.p1 GENE.c21531_g1_i2~~c21531_g1_i2.p1  ORF type:complete len:434 (-),score=175.19 c21531_g1_i2:9-1310(-)
MKSSIARLCRTKVPFDPSKFIVETSRRREPMALRELYPLMRIPGMLNLANGMPNPQTFPFKKVTVTAEKGYQFELSGNELASCLQYGPTAGLEEFNKWVLNHVRHEHAPPSLSEERGIMITTGSQDGLSKAFDMLINSETVVITENPTYPGALQALRATGCHLVGIDIDKYGIRPDVLEHTLLTQQQSGVMAKVLYMIPTGQNPSGNTMSLKRKREIYHIAQKYDLVILEDDPYYYLNFGTLDQDTKHVPHSFLSLDIDGRVIRFDSFSKVFSSGLRLGWVTAPDAFLQRLLLHQQVSTMHASSLSQIITFKLLNHWGEVGFHEHVNQVKQFYKEKRDFMNKLAEKYLSEYATWDIPSAGMFFYIKCTSIKDTKQLIKLKAVQKKVLFVPGNAFCVNQNEISNCVRISYSLASPEMMEEALIRLADLLKEEKK